MPKFIFLILFLQGLIGYGQFQDLEYPTGNFQGVVLEGYVLVEFVEAREYKVVVPYRKDLEAQKVQVYKKGDDLFIKSFYKGFKDSLLVVKVYFQSIQRVVAKGVSEVNITYKPMNGHLSLLSKLGGVIHANIYTKSVEAIVSNGGEIILMGNSAVLDCSVKLDGNIDAKKLLASTVKAKVKSEGKITVNPIDHLEAYASGKGVIQYLGSPATTSVKTKLEGVIEQL